MEFYIHSYSHPKAEQEEKKSFCNTEAETEAYGMHEHPWQLRHP